MPNQVLSTVENNFTKGFVTEFTGLNFPENAATDTDNCEYTLVGDVLRRKGIDYEDNFSLATVDRTGKACNTYKWNNVGGEGNTQIVAVQVGDVIYFYRSSTATILSPLSNQLLVSTVSVNAFLASGSTADVSITECQFSDGNGYLFIFHPDCDPFYCTYTAGSISASAISIQIRDFIGIPEDGIPDNLRPATLTAEHEYNLTNQGWISGSPWQATSTTSILGATGSRTWTVPAGLSATVGQHVNVYYTGDPPPFIPSGLVAMSGNVSSYVGTQLTLAVTSVSTYTNNLTLSGWSLTPISNGYINTWHSAIGNYPSNADVWWNFKDTTGTFNPLITFANQTLGTGPAPKGHYLLPAFSQDRSLASSITGLTTVETTVRPRTGTWFQGRLWYAGVDASQQAIGDAKYYTWTENIYFSQTVIDATQFPRCYQQNDPTSETLFGLLPTDGGVITIQGCGSIFKLFPIQNGMLVFAANGIWFITGSQGIGFSANDYTITKISNVQSISGSSFINVLGLPYFWNEEGIYSVQPSKNGSLEVNPITVDTILSYYESIPLQSKKYVKGDYNPIDYTIQWVYRSTVEADISNRYTYDKILNYNVYNKAFFPYTVDTAHASINGIVYVSNPGGSSSPDPVFKYLTTNGSSLTFSEQWDDDYVDWASSVEVNYDSFFVTGYKLHGQAQRRFSMGYLNMFSRADVSTAYKIQGIWDYATSGNSGKWSSIQTTYNNKPYFGMIFRRHRIRGTGVVLQIKVTSVDGYPFDIMGWGTYENANTGV